MNLTAQSQLRSFWEDLAELLLDILPQDLLILRMLDHWYEREEIYDLRRRIFELRSNTDSTSIENLCEDIAVAASGDGWLLIPPSAEERGFSLERGDENLLIQSSQIENIPTIKVEIQQPWPADVHPPVHSSMTFLDVCQNVLKIHDFPILVEKDLIFDFAEPKRAKWMQEKIRFINQGDLRARVKVAGYIGSDEQDYVWHQTSEEENHRLQACVIFDDPAKTIELTLTKENKLKAITH